MNTIKKAAKKAALAMLVLGFVGAAHAESPDPIVTRQAGQDLMLGNFTGILAVLMLKGDINKLEQPAKAMAAWMRQFPSQFPPGSDSGHETRALPAIWSDPAGFRKAANSLVEAASKLAEFAKAGDAEGVKTQVKAINDACNACHRSYRAR